MKVVLDADGHLKRITKLMDPATRARRVHRRHPIEPAAAEPLADALQATFERDPQPLLRGRLPGVGRPRRADRRRADRRRRLGRGRQPRRPAPGPGDRMLSATEGAGMPLLARMLAAPLSIDVRRGRDRRPRRAARRPADRDRGPGRGRGRPGPGRPDRRRVPRPRLGEAEVFRVAGRHASTRPSSSARRCATGAYEAVVGHRRRPDHRRHQVRRARWRASRWSRSPPTCPTTASARRSRSLEHEKGKGSFGVAHAAGDRRRPGLRARAPRTAGPRRDRRRGQQPVGHRGLGAGGAETRRADRRARADLGPHRGRGGAAPARLDRVRRVPDRAGRGADPVGDGDGGRRLPRPASGGDHEILHADRPALPGHRQPRRAGRARARCSAPTCAEDAGQAAARSSPACARHGLPRSPPIVGLSTASSSPRPSSARRPPGPAATRSWSTSGCPRRRSADAVEEYVRAFGG